MFIFCMCTVQSINRADQQKTTVRVYMTKRNLKIKKMKLTFLTTNELLTIEGGSTGGDSQTINILGNVIYTSTPPLNP